MSTTKRVRDELEPRYRTMLSRCYNPKFPKYRNYGARGIKVCNEWRTFQGFKRWAIASGYKPELQIDRIDNDGDYCPENCRWVTPSQNCNNRGDKTTITAWGETKTRKEWSKDPRCKTTYFSIRQRLLTGRYTPEEAISIPVGTSRR